MSETKLPLNKRIGTAIVAGKELPEACMKVNDGLAVRFDSFRVRVGGVRPIGVQVEFFYKNELVCQHPEIHMTGSDTLNVGGMAGLIPVQID